MAHTIGPTRSNIGTASSVLSSSISWLSQSECDFIRQGCSSHCRTDGRAPTQWRDYTIHSGEKHLSQCVSSSYGSSRLYDTATQGSLIDMVCSVRAELVVPSSAPGGEMEVQLFAPIMDSTASEISRLLRDCEMALQKYYVPCLYNAIRRHSPQRPNDDGCSNRSVLNVIPGAVVWKLYIDVYILSLLSPHNAWHGGGSSVYYLDAVTHGINAALFETMLPCFSILQAEEKEEITGTTDAIINRITLDLDAAQPLLSQPGIPLPIILSAHAIRSVTTTSTHSRVTPNDDWTWILDATAEEAAVASGALHVVHDPSHDTVGAVWTSRGSLPPSVWIQGRTVAWTAAKDVYTHFHSLLPEEER